MITLKEIKKRLKKELFDFKWITEEDGGIYSYVCGAIFEVYIDENDYIVFDFSTHVKVEVTKKLLENNLITNSNIFRLDVLNLDITDDESFCSYDGDICLDNLESKNLDLIIKGIRLWKDWINRLNRNGDRNIDELIIIPNNIKEECFSEMNYYFKFEKYKIGFAYEEFCNYSKKEFIEEFKKNSNISISQLDINNLDKEYLANVQDSIKYIESTYGRVCNAKIYKANYNEG